VARYDDLRPFLQKVKDDPTGRTKTYLLLSCGTEQSSLDACSVYFGTGSKEANRNKPLLWAWACEVQFVVSHSEDWTSAKVKVHWYRLAPNAKKRWVCAFWDPQSKYTAAGRPKLVWDAPDADDPKYWYMEEYNITIGQVIVAFDSFDMDNNGKQTDAAGQIIRDSRGKAVKTKVYKLTQKLQDHCENECRYRHEAHVEHLAQARSTAACTSTTAVHAHPSALANALANMPIITPGTPSAPASVTVATPDSSAAHQGRAGVTPGQRTKTRRATDEVQATKATAKRRRR
jgi:hypothetical protein